MKLHILFCIFLIISVPGCVDRIDLATDAENTGNLAIQGKLVAGPTPIFEGRVNRLFQFDAESRSSVNLNAFMIRNDLGQSLQIPQVSTGLYRLPINKQVFDVSTERSYQIQIETFDQEIYESTFETLLPKARTSEIIIDTITKEFFNRRLDLLVERKFHQIKVNVDFEIPGQSQRARILWDFYRSPGNILRPHPFLPSLFCGPDNIVAPGGVSLFDGNTLSDNIVQDLEVATFSIDVALDSTCLIFYQQSLSETAFAYWQNLNNLIDRDGNFLDPFPGKLQGNLTNINDPEEEVFGYFYATFQDTLFLYE